MVRITGNTYPCRAQLHALGGQWVERTKSWWVPEDKVVEAKALLAAHPREPRLVPAPSPEVPPKVKRWGR